MLTVTLLAELSLIGIGSAILLVSVAAHIVARWFLGGKELAAFGLTVAPLIAGGYMTGILLLARTVMA